VRCRLDSGVRLAAGDLLEVEVRVRGEPLRMPARVAHVAPDSGAQTREAGLAFVDLDPGTADRLAAYVAQLFDGAGD
jgi:hypothetical protein